jgi:taurine dioxygenase
MKVVRCERLGVEVSHLKIQSATSKQVDELLNLVYANKLVILTGQVFGELDYLEFARRLGEPYIDSQSYERHPDWPEIIVSSSAIRDKGKPSRCVSASYWQTACAYTSEPLPLTMLAPLIVPRASSGTSFIDMEEIYELLPARLREFAEAHHAIHDAKWRYKVRRCDLDRSLIDILDDCHQLLPPAFHPLVIEHPVRRTRSLYISSGFTVGFRHVAHEESRLWLEELLEFVEREEHVHERPWQEGEILLWDNRVLIHTPAHAAMSEASLSHQIGIFDGLPFYLPVHSAATEPSLAAAPFTKHQP